MRLRLLPSLLAATLALAWRELPSSGPLSPGARTGSTLVAWGGVLYLFGGRGGGARVAHDPTTYEIARVNGSYQFVTYEGRHVRTCAAGVGYEECYGIDVATRFNDVWAYSEVAGGPGSASDGMSTSDSRPSGAWSLVLPGAPLGGCVLVDGAYACSHPYERSHQGGGVTADGTLFVYGGSAPMCGDYCGDLWVLSLSACREAAGGGGEACRWRQLVLGVEVAAPAASGGGAEAPAPVASEGPSSAPPRDSSARCSASPAAGPGARWRMAQAQPPPGDGDGGGGGSWQWVMFGGHRAPRPAGGGGYLDDLWTLSGLGGGGGGGGAWRQVLPAAACASRVGGTWSSAGGGACSLSWPPPRAGGALAVAGGASGALFLHGGFTAGYPYPRAGGREPGLGPFPEGPRLLGDLWVWRWGAGAGGGGLWAQARALGRGGAPPPRWGHSLTPLRAGAGLLLFGGSGREGRVLGDTWLLNASALAWRLRASHTQPLLPAGCTSDVLAEGAAAVAAAEGAGAACPGGRAPQRLETPAGPLLACGRSVAGEPSRGVPGARPLRIPQPRRAGPGWDGCRDRAEGGRPGLPAGLQWRAPAHRSEHAALAAPWAGREEALLLWGGAGDPEGGLAGAPEAAPASALWSWSPSACAGGCSGRGACEWGACICAPGWHGLDCSNASCPGSVCALDPTSRATTCRHCCSAPLLQPHPRGLAALAPGAQALLALWANPWAQPWSAAAVAAALRDPGDASSLRRGACTLGGDGEPARGASRGTCDGFGACQCLPPFTGPDCSVLDCPGGCGGHGACIQDFPVSRCACEADWGGRACEARLCPANCSWPRGECNTSSGLCACAQGSAHDCAAEAMQAATAGAASVMPDRALAVAAALIAIGAAWA